MSTYQRSGIVSEIEQEFLQEFGDDTGEGPESEYDEPDSDGSRNEEFARRLREIGRISREIDSDETDSELSRIFREMEDEFFFKGLAKKLRKAGKKGLKLVNKGIRVVQSNPLLRNTVGNLPAFQAINAATQLARGNLRGVLASAAKGYIPGVAPVLNAIGMEATTSDEDPAERFVQLAREAYAYLGDNLGDQPDDIAEAGRLARESFEAGLQSIRRMPSGDSGRIVRLRVGAGERITVVIEGR